jgi:phospholipase D1/2
MLDLICIAMLLVVIIVYKVLSLKDSPISFAPVRDGEAVWYVDGEDYMAAVADAIEAAETEILITDWQMSPEIFMKRPASGVDSVKWRLDNMLIRKAENGVKVCILLYWEVKRLMDLGSDHVVELLKHENIEVHRHPHTVTGLLNLFHWSHHEKMVIVDRSIAFVGGIDLCYGRWDTRQHNLMDNYPTHATVNGSENSSHIHARWIGKDYRNTFYNKEKETGWDAPLLGYEGVERNKIPRMPWHDVSCAFTGEAVHDAVKHFSERKDVITRPSWFVRIWNFFTRNTPDIEQQPIPSKNTKVEEIVTNSGSYNVNIQLLRSVDSWSAGQKHEASIYNAYLYAIKKAEHFIYIENQFFISSQKNDIQNKIQTALFERIVRAHKAGEDFHVMVITPLKPELPGDWDDKYLNGHMLRAVAYWNQATFNSLLTKLENEKIPKERYFSVYSLRKYDLIEEQYVTEIVYVHSKIMIVDDRLAIIGSANINDRSMLGSRDSEVAVIIEDLNTIDGQRKFAASLRFDLLKEHLGLVGDEDEIDCDIKIDDPLASSFIKYVNDRAKSNTKVFQDVFGPGLFPNENVEDFDMYEQKKKEAIAFSRKDLNTERGMLKQIQGNLVKYPGTFLIEELQPLPIFNPVASMGPRLDQPVETLPPLLFMKAFCGRIKVYCVVKDLDDRFLV